MNFNLPKYWAKTPTPFVIHNTSHCLWQTELRISKPIFLALFCASLSTSIEAGSPFITHSRSVANRQVVQGHVPAVTTKLPAITRLDPSKRLSLAITLPVRDREELNSFLQQLYDPASSIYRRYLTPDQFAASFGPPEKDYQAVCDFARARGLTVTTTFPSRLIVDVAGSVTDIEQALHLTLQTYQHPTENRQFFAPDVEPSLDLAVPILHIGGLDNYDIPHPASLHAEKLDPKAPMRPNLGSGATGTYIGNDFRNAYLPGVLLAGEGQSVGLLEFDGYYLSDVNAYVKKANIPGVPLLNVYVNGFNGTPGSANTEVALDIEVLMAMAPNLSSIIVYEASGGTSFADMFSRMASDTQVKQFSSSWAGGKPDSAADQVLLQMAAQGQSVFNAAGDSCAYTGQIPYPCDSPYLTSVGGTTLTTDANGGYVSEQVWNSGGGLGSGGGISTFYPIPSWQQTVNMTANSGSTTLRNIPDVALTADNIFIIADNGSEETVGGTSAAAPLWAAVTALANQQTTAGCGASIGFLNPIIYGIGKGGGYADTMHDIVKGDNTSPGSPTKFHAVVGYDLSTGWGTPKPDLLTLLAGPATGAISVSVLPLPGSALISTDVQPVSVTISGVTNALVFASISGSTNALIFTNFGFVYSSPLQLPPAPAILTLTLIASSPGLVGSTNTFSYSIVPRPLNDAFASSSKVPATGAAFVTNNKYATMEPDEPLQDGDAYRAGSLWWSWAPAVNTNVLIDTSGSKVDNVLAVYAGNDLTSLVPLASASSSIAQLHPGQVSFNAQAGQAYRISMASLSSNTLGSLKLSVLPGTTPDTTPPLVTISSPPNGLTVSNRVINITGTAADAGPYSTGVNKVVVTVNGCGGNLASGTESWVAPIQLQQGLNVVQAVAYDEAGNASAPITIQLDYQPANLANDFFADAIALLGANGTNSVDTSTATKEPGEPDHAGIAGGKSVWWSFVPPSDGVLTLITSGSAFDTVLAIYTGMEISNLTPVGSDDDAYPGAPGGFSLLNQAVHSNVVYYIALDGYGGASGLAVLTYSFAPADLLHLSANAIGSGAIQVAAINSLGGENIQHSASVDLASGTKIQLTATPGPGFFFDSWSGALTSFRSPVSFILNSNVEITAHFIAIVFSDDFESGNLQHLNWIAAGDQPWAVESTNVVAGGYAARSGVIGNNQSSSLILTTNFAASTGSFDYRVSSEPTFDFLKFFIDRTLIQQWSGEAGWATFSFPVPLGSHTLEWRYVKDPNGSAGFDAAFVDNVSLPILLPTDATTAASLSWSLNTDGSLTLNLEGQVNQQYVLQTSSDLIHWQNVSTATAQNGLVRINLDSLAGPYQFYRAIVP